MRSPLPGKIAPTLLSLPVVLALLSGCAYDGALLSERMSEDGGQFQSTTPPPAAGDRSAASGTYPGSEKFGELSYNGFVLTSEDNLSTFGVDVDNGSYTFGRKKLNSGLLPPSASVRVEEYLNYFRQDYTPPSVEPFAVSVDGAPSPFRAESLHVLRIGIQGRAPSQQALPWNLTFLIDVSGSMTGRLDLVKQSLYVLVDNMRSGDRISICTYAGSVGTVLAPTNIAEKDKATIKGIISELRAGGSTAMGSGIRNAYGVNQSGFVDGGVNRVIVCSDGDANVGPTSHEDILALIESHVESGVTLSTIGFGLGNYNDYLMEQLANSGNGNYYYIDSDAEAVRLFTEELSGVMEVIAKDVKVQVEFNEFAVLRYRLIGYENRDIADEDFVRDTTDAGEIGAGHRVTALYEVQLASGASGTLATVHFRYKQPHGSEDIQSDIVVPMSEFAADISQASARLRFTVGVAQFAEMLRESPFAGTDMAAVEELVAESMREDDDRDVEFLSLVRTARSIRGH